MPGIDEAWVRKRAHEIWEAEGRPEGRDFDHWFAATEEFRLLAVDVPVKKPAAKKAARKPVEAKSEAAPVSEPEPAKAAPKKRAAAKKPKA